MFSTLKDWRWPKRGYLQNSAMTIKMVGRQYRTESLHDLIVFCVFQVPVDIDQKALFTTAKDGLWFSVEKRQ